MGAARYRRACPRRPSRPGPSGTGVLAAALARTSQFSSGLSALNGPLPPRPGHASGPSPPLAAARTYPAALLPRLRPGRSPTQARLACSEPGCPLRPGAPRAGAAPTLGMPGPHGAAGKSGRHPAGRRARAGLARQGGAIWRGVARELGNCSWSDLRVQAHSGCRGPGLSPCSS